MLYKSCTALQANTEKLKSRVLYLKTSIEFTVIAIDSSSLAQALPLSAKAGK